MYIEDLASQNMKLGLKFPNSSSFQAKISILVLHSAKTCQFQFNFLQKTSQYTYFVLKTRQYQDNFDSFSAKSYFSFGRGLNLEILSQDSELEILSQGGVESIIYQFSPNHWRVPLRLGWKHVYKTKKKCKHKIWNNIL